MGLKEGMGTCSICRKISATDNDHLHCIEKRRIELENVQLKDTITEKLDLEKQIATEMDRQGNRATNVKDVFAAQTAELVEQTGISKGLMGMYILK